LVELSNRFEIVVRSTESLNINSHAFKDLIRGAIGTKFEELSLVVLEEFISWINSVFAVSWTIEKTEMISLIP
jgi:hypothetical protein